MTAEQLRTWFREFNRLYFGDNLPEPRFVVNNARTRLGQYSCQRVRRGWLWGTKTVGHTIKVSDYYDVPEREFQNVLLHEMIHFYISYKGIRDTSPHGREFRRLMQWLNTEHGWHITISTRTKSWPVSEHNQARLNVLRRVVAIETAAGHCYFSVVHPDYVRYVDKQATASRQVKSHQWFTTAHPFFADFPQTRSLRGRRLKRPEFEELLRQLQE